MAKRQLLARLQSVLPDQGDVEIIAQVGTNNLTRFSNNMIHQNMTETNARVYVRYIEDSRLGSALTNSLEPKGLVEAVRQARDAARLQNLPSSPVQLGTTAAYKDLKLFDPEILSQTAQTRAETVARCLNLAGRANMVAAGALSTAAQELALVNTRGLKAWTQATLASFHTVTSLASGAGSGYGSSYSRTWKGLQAMPATLEAAAKCQASFRPGPLAPGEYTVILEPAAVFSLISFLSMLGFNGLALLEGRSPFPDLGSKYLGDNITIWDDGLDAAGMAMPFDYQGVPKRPLTLVSKGVVQNVAMDHGVAAALDKTSTGHAQLPPDNRGPVPSHLFMEPGNAMLDDMIVSTKRGILVTRFHYVNVLDPHQAVITGMTRDGTLLVEEGCLTGALSNLRFTQNLVTALNNVEMVGDETRVFGWLWGSIRVPALKIRGFNITGSEIR